MALVPTSLTFPAKGGEATVTIESFEGHWSIAASTSPDWLSFGATEGTMSEDFRCVCAANPTAKARTARVRFDFVGDGDEWSEYLDVEQEAGDGYALQYEGEFPDIRGNVWRCEILRTGYTGDSSALEFPADSPLVIEWPSTNFEDAVWGSSATLKIVSPGDRTYIDLYTTEPGAIRLDVYKNGELYWSGTLDTEFYEEPYERLRGYEVELTFTDFGILDRLRYDLGGQQTVRAVLDRAVLLTGIAHAVYEDDEVSAEFFPIVGLRRYEESERDSSLLFSNGISVMSENFTDEEGEVSSWYEAVEGILRPLGLKMCQRGGEVRLFDPAGLREGGSVRPVAWSGDSQTLGVDRVYNGVRVTFSPYAHDELAVDTVSYTGEYDPAWYDTTPDNSNRDTTAHGHRCNTLFPTYNGKYNTGFDSTDLDFTIFHDAGLDGASTTTGQAFHILPVYGSADECDGWMYGFYAGNAEMNQYRSNVTLHGNQPGGGATGTNRVFTLARVRIPAVKDADERSKWLIRLVQEMLADCRYNPFSDAGDYNEGSSQSALTSNSAFVFIRAACVLYDAQEGGNALYHYDNSAVATGDGEDTMKFGVWVAGDDPDASLWLEWCDHDDLTDNSAGAGGWKTNRHCVGKPDGRGSRNEYERCGAGLRNAPDGEYIPYPPAGGWLEVALTSSLYGYAWRSNRAVGDSDDWGDASTAGDVRNRLRWRLYRAPEVRLVRNGLFFDAADLDDVEYSGVLDPAAQDELTIDTVCGTCDDAPPTAWGAYVNSNGSQLPELYRAGVTARVEDLLIGQLYGQYAARKTVLTGEAEIPGTLLLTEDNQSGKTFILTADSEDIRMGVGDIEIRELGEDTYIPES